ncbi:thermostable alkaline protease [Lichtheimia corymbifera JMRC:FSU:9682]|uniref:Thermostable alkaline protease n=1 Tax=Lichtheimia corymbifera JMRC:FSU:9682 TaxID=1263082 RepID=A0A068RUU5_9FUNG|nr:thermostable alkaline protease [Lichtheimia corymbifera JMRC:FSU:9682]
MKLLNPFCGLAAAVWLFTIVSAADDKQRPHPKYDPSGLLDIVPGRFIVEYAEPNVQATSKKLLDLLHGKFDSTNVSVSQSYDHPLMRGVTLRIDSTKKKDDDDDENVVESMSTPKDDIVKEVIEMLEKQSMVSTVYPVRLVRRPELVPTPMKELDRRDGINMNAMQPHAMSQVERVHRELKNTGKGIVVGIIDSGIDYRHPALGSCFGKGCKVAMGYDLVGNAYDARNPASRPQPGPDPMDNCGRGSGANGHGTHVAGIVAGKSENFKGVAPDATLGMWRVFGCQGLTSNDVIIQAMLDAYEAGVDVISMSLGFGSGWADTPTSVVAQRIAAKGIPVIAAAGNEGEQGAMTLGAPSVGHGVTSVASMDTESARVSVFSSIGPSSEIDFKPDIAGFGGNVYSTLPSYLGGWGAMSGTSMATPYCAGAVALYLKQAEKNQHMVTDPKFITEQFQNYAYKAPNSHANGIDSPLAQGAGLIQVYDTIMQNVHITPGALSFNDTANIVRTQKLKIRNTGDSTVSYQITNNASVAIQPYDGKNGYIFSEPVTYIDNAKASIRFSQKTIKLAPGKSATIKVTLTPPKTNPDDHIMYGGYIQFKSQTPDNKDLTVPYFGIVGEQHKLPIFMPGSPVVSDASGSQWYKNKDDVFVFDTRSGNIPYFVYGFQTPTAHVKATLYTADGRQELGNVQPGMDYLGRTTLTEPYSSTFWDGTYQPTASGSSDFPVTRRVPRGRYRIGWKALRLLGDRNNSNDWESWMSCIIQVV